jgi:hypothetical protein
MVVSTDKEQLLKTVIKETVVQDFRHQVFVH